MIGDFDNSFRYTGCVPSILNEMKRCYIGTIEMSSGTKVFIQ